MEYILLAIAPGIAICLFIFHRDLYNREPKINMLASFFFGAVSIIPAFYIEKYFMGSFSSSISGIALTAFFVVALTEELCKFTVLRLYAFPKKSYDEPLDGIVYGVMVSMGFATVENIMYVTKFGLQTGVLRMFLSVPAHATFGVLMGYFAGKAKFDPPRRTYLLLMGLFWAVFFHGLYDTLLFWQASTDMENYISDGLLFLGAIVSFILALRLSFKHIKTHRLLSQRTFMPLAGLTLRRAYASDVPLIRNLSQRIWPQTYSTIISPQQLDYMMNLMYSENALLGQMKENHEFIIVHDHQDAVGFASFSMIEPGVYKLHKIYLLPETQGKGMGKFVIDQLIKAIKSRGGNKLRLNVNRNNKAKDFYEKIGFKILHEEDIDIGSGYFMNDYVMEKELAN
jgi:RsiW-degrading membrane proteinase PrsW (M82 family)/ribosomal protein S18 acetylase RimI-like enzyme